jgi:hypothetical protein
LPRVISDSTLSSTWVGVELTPALIFSVTYANAIISTFPRTNLDIDLSGKYIVITGKAGSVLD